MFEFMENFYQIAFNSYIVASLLIFIIFILLAQNSVKYTLIVITVYLSGYVFSKLSQNESTSDTIFNQNGRYSYSGIKYSKAYTMAVKEFAKNAESCMGAYIADSSYYKNLHPGTRNPNLYHLPITYIISNYTTVNDFCLSDPEAIKYDTWGTLKNNRYLNNAISRSYYHRLYNNYSLSDTMTLRNIKEFILSNHLRYVILTPGIKTEGFPGIKIKKVITDANTKERFLILD
jgi:hypothetical protein